MAGLFIWLFRPSPLLAVVGKAEQYSESEQANLEEFHDSLVHEEQFRQLKQAEALELKMRRKKNKTPTTIPDNICNTNEPLAGSM